MFTKWNVNSFICMLNKGKITESGEIEVNIVIDILKAYTYSLLIKLCTSKFWKCIFKHKLYLS